MGGCLACCHKPVSAPSLDEQPKELITRGETGGISGDYWSTSLCDMESSAVRSHGSMSSFNTSIQAPDAHAGVSGSDPSSEFVNHGLLLWNQTRQRWVGNKKQNSRGEKVRDPKLSNHGFSVVDSFWPCSWNATYESLLGTNKPFAQPVPLAEMVDFLVDIWEQEGMYD